MVRIRVHVEDQKALDALARVPEALRDALGAWVAEGSQFVRGVMVQTIRDRQKQGTGYLSNSVRVEARPGGFTVGPTADYAVFVDQPTGPHIIRPVRKQALAFPQAGGRITRSRSTGHVRTSIRVGGARRTTDAVFARLVHHPGTKGMFFIDATA